MATRYNWMADTDERAFEVLVELTRKLSPGEKLAQVFEMMEMGRRMDEDRIRKLHPNTSGREVFLRTAAIRLGSDGETGVRVGSAQRSSSMNELIVSAAVCLKSNGTMSSA